MKHTSIFLTLLTLVLISACEKDKEIIEIENNIKSIYVEPEHRLYSEEYYSDNGLKEFEIIYDTSSVNSKTILEKHLYDYSKDNIISSIKTLSKNDNLTSEEFYENIFDENENLTSSYIDYYKKYQGADYTYNEKNQLESFIYYNYSEYIVKYEFLYNEMGDTTIAQVTDPRDFEDIATLTYVYNDNNQIIKIEDYDIQQDILHYLTTYRYDVAGYLVEELKITFNYSESGDTILYKKYERDNIGREISLQEYKTSIYLRDVSENYFQYEYSSEDFAPQSSILGEKYYEYALRNHLQ